MDAKFVGLAVCLCIGFSGAAGAATMDDPASKDVLAAMERTSTWGHPDQFGEFAGMRYYASGNYGEAMKYFEYGARYADKLSQLSIGLMYLRGGGVERNPATAYAWLALAAERNYPRYAATRDEVWNQLDAAQREQAKVELAQLSADYGDAVAKPRMAKELRRARSEMTGSLVGYGGIGVASMTAAQLIASSGGRVAARLGPSPLPACGAASIDGAPITGCGNIYVAWRWDPKEYFRIRDAAWTGTVKVGNPQNVTGDH